MRLMTVVALFFITICTATSHAATPVATIPYNVEFNGWYTVDVEINNKGPYKFIVDTGATLTAVYESMTHSQSFPLSGEAPRHVLGIVGAQTLPSVMIGDLNIGGVKMNNHIGVVISDWSNDKNKPDGVLGLDFLTQYTVLFNAKTKQIELYDPIHPPTDIMKKMSRTRLKLNTFNRDYGSLYTITLQVGGRKIPCILDLGADGTIINYRAMRSLMGGVYVGNSRTAGSTTGSKIKDVFGDESVVRSIIAGPIKIGNAYWGRQQLIIYNAGIFRELGLIRKSHGLLGADLFKNRNFILDFKNERFYVSRKAVKAGS